MFYKIVNKIKSLFKKEKPASRPKMLINWNGTDYTYDEFLVKILLILTDMILRNMTKMTICLMKTMIDGKIIRRRT